MTNLSLIKRDDVDLDITFTDKNGDPIDLNGCTVFFTMKRKLTDVDEDAVIEKEITSHVDPTNGETRVSLTNEETNIKPGYYFYDVQVEDEEAKIISSAVGQIRILQDVTIRTIESS